ncbi:hypothetical protein TRIUR3_01279 [Triticum urartu]|uniref:Uncharacterized protein n=1 Tax=Triticum urartu TaxID=4572 RepID=M7YI12_TRIUA|nr:hypothetical protein TRIUR3_01279 [Triticum urartu]
MHTVGEDAATAEASVVRREFAPSVRDAWAEGSHPTTHSTNLLHPNTTTLLEIVEELARVLVIGMPCHRAFIADYCTTLEGDDCCSCWDAYFELNKLEQELPQEEISRMVKDSRSDPRYLISSIHHRSDLRKKMAEKAHNSAPSNSPGQTAKPRPFPVPDGLPKTQEEIDEDEEALMPESPYTRLLRRMGRFPDWYTPRPDHETD